MEPFTVAAPRVTPSTFVLASALRARMTRMVCAASAGVSNT